MNKIRKCCKYYTQSGLVFFLQRLETIESVWRDREDEDEGVAKQCKSVKASQGSRVRCHYYCSGFYSLCCSRYVQIVRKIHCIASRAQIRAGKNPWDRVL